MRANPAGQRPRPTSTVTFLFTDVEGSTKLLRELGPDRFADALAEHRGVLRQAFGRRGGVEVDTQGDAFFVVFERAADAVAAAAEVQDLLAGGGLRVRIGLHTGEAERTQEGWVGMDVHRAARICAAGHGGQVVLSRATLEAAGCPEGACRDLGEHRLKDMPGPEWLFQLGNEDFPPLRSLNNTNLPTALAPLVGRGEELAEIRRLLAAHRLVTLTGAGGSGKTRLATAAALELLTDFPNGVFIVSLASISEPSLVLPEIARTIGVREEVGRPLAATLAAALARRRLLFVLDNLEQVVAAAADVAALLEQAPGVHVLATSREPLRLVAEHELVIAPLPPDDAVALFRERAAVAEPEEAVREICRLLDGLPLAVELAAARTRLLRPPELLARLDDRLGLLTRGPSDLPERHRTLRATIDWSYRLLEPGEDELFCALGIFAGAFTLAAAEAVCEADPAALESLVEKSLVQPPREDGMFAMLATMREFALERLAEAGRASRLRDRHAHHFVHFAESAEPGLRGLEQAEWLRRTDAVLPDLRDVLAWALNGGELDLGLRLAGALSIFWQLHGHVSELRSWLDRALGPPGPATPGRAKALFVAGRLALAQGEYRAAADLYARSRAVFGELGDASGLARTFMVEGEALDRLGDAEGALAACERAVALARPLDDPWLLSSSLGNLAYAILEREPSRARSLYEEALELSRRTGPPANVAGILLNLGFLALLERRAAEAIAPLEESAAICRDLGDTYTLPHVLANLGWAHLELGNVDAAARLFGEVLAELSEDDAPRLAVESAYALAAVAAETGDATEAAVRFGAAEGARQELGAELEPLERAVIDGAIALAREELGEAAWFDAAARGRGMPLGRFACDDPAGRPDLVRLARD